MSQDAKQIGFAKLDGQSKDFSVTNRFSSLPKVHIAWFSVKGIKKWIINKLILSKDLLGDAFSYFQKEEMIGLNLSGLNWSCPAAGKLFRFWRIDLLLGCVGGFSQQSNTWHWNSCHFLCRPCKDMHLSYFKTQFNFNHQGFLFL